MGRVFGKTTVWFRLKCYFADTKYHIATTFMQIISLPSYINPKPLKPTELSEEEKNLLIDEED